MSAPRPVSTGQMIEWGEIDREKRRAKNQEVKGKKRGGGRPGPAEVVATGGCTRTQCNVVEKHFGAVADSVPEAYLGAPQRCRYAKPNIAAAISGDDQPKTWVIMSNSVMLGASAPCLSHVS